MDAPTLISLQKARRTERASLASAIDEAGAGDGDNGADGAELAPASSVGLVSGSVDTATLRDPSGDAAREEAAAWEPFFQIDRIADTPDLYFISGTADK